jgi:hypothetical protein
MWMIGVGLAVVIASMLAVVLIVLGAVYHQLTRFERCPACGAKALVKTGQAPIPGSWQGSGCIRWQAQLGLHGCRACDTEFCREQAGELIWKAAWDAGARAAPPTARVISSSSR